MKASGAFALPKPRAVADAVCGAPAQAQAAAEEQKLAQHNDPDGKHLDSASDWEVCQYNHQPYLIHEGASTVIDTIPSMLLSCN